MSAIIFLTIINHGFKIKEILTLPYNVNKETDLVLGLQLLYKYTVYMYVQQNGIQKYPVTIFQASLKHFKNFTKVFVQGLTSYLTIIVVSFACLHVHVSRRVNASMKLEVTF